MNKEEIKIRLNIIQTEVEELKKIINSSDNVIDRIKTFNDVCIEFGTTEEEFNKKYENIEYFVVDFKKITMIADVLNEGWVPDWNNKNEYKYYPWFEMDSFGFDGTNFGYWHASSVIGSRLCFKSEKLSEYAGKQFIDIYKNVFYK